MEGLSRRKRMTSNPAVIFEEDLVLPAGISDLDGFRRWTRDEAFPERGRIDYLAGTVEVDLRPEDLYTHGVVKTAITARLYPLIVDAGRGNLFSDRSRRWGPARLRAAPRCWTAASGSSAASTNSPAGCMTWRPRSERPTAPRHGPTCLQVSWSGRSAPDQK